MSGEAENNSLEKWLNAVGGRDAELPALSLWQDVRAKIFGDDDIEWLLLYEVDPVAFIPRYRMLYIKARILTTEGRRKAQSGQYQFLCRCDLFKFETATISRALAVAMNLWDREH